MQNTLSRHRRALHQIPEIHKDLPKTFAYIESVLKTLDCEILLPGENAILAFFDRKKPQTVAFRSDMDALPIAEKTGLAFASKHPGAMHACGHDGHMAMLLGFAEYINGQKNLNDNVLLVFQPAEETTGGAKDICETGVLQKYNTRAVFGIHLWPDLPAGVIASRPGEMMARASQITVEIAGKSAHIAKHTDGTDALFAGAEFVHALYKAERAAFPESVFRVLKFGTMQSGNVRNAVSDKTVLEGSLRTFQDDVFFALKDITHKTAKKIEGQTGCKIVVDFNEGYPPVTNDPLLFADISAKLGGSLVPLAEPSLIAEDFSFYQNEVPGVFFFLGIGGEEPLHSDKLVFDESVLLKGFGLYQKLL